MPAPQITFTKDFNKVSLHQHISVTFSADISYKAFEARATVEGSDYGLGKGTLLSSFSLTPANTFRDFAIYNSNLVNGDTSYRISLYAQGEDGAWNDDIQFYVKNGSPIITVDNNYFMVQRS